MSGSRRGPDPRWGPMAPGTTVRLPAELSEVAKNAATARSWSFNELVIRAVARELGYDLTTKPPQASQQEPLPLIDDQEHAAA